MSMTSGNVSLAVVSLFTREWIEIRMQSQRLRLPPRLPLYEGVD